MLDVSTVRSHAQPGSVMPVSHCLWRCALASIPAAPKRPIGLSASGLDTSGSCEKSAVMVGTQSRRALTRTSSGTTKLRMRSTPMPRFESN
jgi:hypothetical protein